jgi:transposase
MPHLSAEAKHHILLEYSPRSATHSFAALAARHGVGGGGRTVQRWYSRWDRTPESLQEGKRTGRPHALSRAQASRHVRAPILAANRAHRAVRYTDLTQSVRAKTGASVSVRTLRRYGQEMGATKKRGTKRTAEEREYMEPHRRVGARMCALSTTHSLVRHVCA